MATHGKHVDLTDATPEPSTSGPLKSVKTPTPATPGNIDPQLLQVANAALITSTLDGSTGGQMPSAAKQITAPNVIQNVTNKTKNQQLWNPVYKPPVMPTAAGGTKAIEKYEKDIEDFHTALVYNMRADKKARRWYCAKLWTQWYQKRTGEAITLNIEKHFKTARVYYLPHFVEKSEITRLTSAIPAVCSTGDGHIQLISSVKTPSPPRITPNTRPRKRHEEFISPYPPDVDEKLTFDNLPSTVNACPYLLDIFERRRKRMTCIASHVDLLGRFGLGNKAAQRYREKTIRRDVIVVTAVGPQFGLSYLDFDDLIFSEDNYKSRLACYDRLGSLPGEFSHAMAHAKEEVKTNNVWRFNILPGGRLFHVYGYLQTMKDSFFLWLRAFDDQVRHQNIEREKEHKKKKKGYIQITAIGCGLFAKLPGWMSKQDGFQYTLMQLLVQAVEEVLDENYFPDIIKIGFCDFSGQAKFSPNKDYRGHINTTACPMQDLCDFDNKEVENYVCGILNPGNAFSLPGNTAGYSSVEAEVGENTTMRTVQNWIHNRNLVDPRFHVAVDGPDQIAAGRQTSVTVPCIISDSTSVQDYTWDGVAMPEISGIVEREHSP